MPYYLCCNLRFSLTCLLFLMYTRSVLVRHFSVGQKVLTCSEFAKCICVIKCHQKYCINIHCQLNQCAFSSVILSCLSVCLRITKWIFLKFYTEICHTKFSSHCSLALDHIIFPYNLHDDWLIFLMHIFVFLRVKKYLNKIEGMHQHSYSMHLFPYI